MLPGTTLSVTIFPVFIRLSDISGLFPEIIAEINLGLEGPVLDFTAIQDLENSRLRVFGNSLAGYFLYTIHPLREKKGILISAEKLPNQITILCAGKLKANKDAFNQGESITISEDVKGESAAEVAINNDGSIERLSLGSHKKQDWELVRRRLLLSEIFPVWFRLGQMSPQLDFNVYEGIPFLLQDCEGAIAGNAPEKILSSFKNLFLIGFDGILSPRSIDTEHHGIKYPNIDFSKCEKTKSSPLCLLTEGARLIRSLFLQEKRDGIHVLPALPPEFHCGRMLDLKCGNGGKLSLEWTKKSLRSMTFTASVDQTINFKFSNHEKKCRLRSSNKDKGMVYIPGTELTVIKGQDYWFDNFQR